MRLSNYLLLSLLSIGSYRTYKAYNMINVDIKEFRGLQMFVSSGVIERYDKFVRLIGGHCKISPARGSIVRFSVDPRQITDHFRGGALDIMITNNAVTLRQAYFYALESGFNAIGIYPFWKPYKGLHLGLRKPIDKLFRWSDMSKIPGKHDYQHYTKGFDYD